MFDFGFSEIFLLSLVALLVLGPARLPEIMRTCGLWLGRARRVYNNVRLEIEREVGMDDIRRQLHNEQIMSELEAVEKEAKTFKNEIQSSAQIPTGVDKPDSKEDNESKDSIEPPADSESKPVESTDVQEKEAAKQTEG
ncbi:MAG: Sec-independent protein translocase protein TatB [Gammaproteobacteria bacterium]|nr:Sec-independent protein translocase protein TatB [Gammaproteobacteria bacterium]